MNFKVREQVLLTGAGFTKNFGGYLADEMWACIFSSKEVQKHPKLLSLLRNNYDYEEVYSRVMYGNFDTPTKGALERALRTAYEDLDSILRDFEQSQKHTCPVDLDKLADLVGAFAGNGNERGYAFTLNHDLLVERWYISKGVKLHMPGIPNRVTEKRNAALKEDDILTLPTGHELGRHRERDEEDVRVYGRFQYIKLHGSWNWRTSDGRSAMAIGLTKSRLLANEPLLSFYLSLFKKVLYQKNRRLLVIGYGFRDTHINAIIANAIQKQNLRLYVVNPSSPGDFKKSLMRRAKRPSGKSCAKVLWNALAGYFQYKLADVCPCEGYYNLRQTVPFKQIQTALFE